MFKLNSKQLFIKANEILIQELEIFKDNLRQISNKEDTRISIESIDENIYTLYIYGSDDTIGNVIQQEISKNINEDSDIIVCGYKKVHPLENIISFNLSLKPDKTKEKHIITIIETFTETCNNIIEIYNMMISEAKKNL